MLPRETLIPLGLTVVGGGAVVAVLFLAPSPEPRPLEPPDVRAPTSALMIPLRDDTGRGWSVADMTSAQRALVVEIETKRLGEAVAIAQQVVEPVKDRYDEILVYFFDDPNATPRLAALRVQWTPRDGYQTMRLRRD